MKRGELTLNISPETFPSVRFSVLGRIFRRTVTLATLFYSVALALA